MEQEQGAMVLRQETEQVNFWKWQTWGMFDNLQSPTLTWSLQPPMTVSHKICSLLPKIMDMQRWFSLSCL